MGHFLLGMYHSRSQSPCFFWSHGQRNEVMVHETEWLWKREWVCTGGFSEPIIVYYFFVNYRLRLCPLFGMEWETYVKY